MVMVELEHQPLNAFSILIKSILIPVARAGHVATTNLREAETCNGHGFWKERTGNPQFFPCWVASSHRAPDILLPQLSVFPGQKSKPLSL